MPPPILEPISAGVVVFLLNKYLISKLNFCYPCELVEQQMHLDHEDDVSSTNTTVTDASSSYTSHTDVHVYHTT
jgi:hypothetical protein